MQVDIATGRPSFQVGPDTFVALLMLMLKCEDSYTKLPEDDSQRSGEKSWNPPTCIENLR